MIDGVIAFTGSQNIVEASYGHKRAGVWHGNHAVDHRQLAMVAQVEPGERQTPERSRQNGEDPHALLSQPRRQPAKQPPRANPVGQHAARHAATRRPGQHSPTRHPTLSSLKM